MALGPAIMGGDGEVPPELVDSDGEEEMPNTFIDEELTGLDLDDDDVDEDADKFFEELAERAAASASPTLASPSRAASSTTPDDSFFGVEGGMGLPPDEAHPPKLLPTQEAQHPLDEAQERRKRAQREQEKWAAKLNLAEVVFPENSLMTADVTQKEYLEMEVVLDSGAGAHVANKAHIPGYAVVPSALSKAGAAFVGADGGRIKNHGEAALQLVTLDGKGEWHAVHSNFQIADVTRALWSVGVICDSGLNVLFAADHASVLNNKGKELCRFERKNGLYIASVLLKNPAYVPASDEARGGAEKLKNVQPASGGSTQGFQRQGR